MAGARDERRLLRVGSTAWFGWESPNARPHCMLLHGRSSTPQSTHAPAYLSTSFACKRSVGGNGEAEGLGDLQVHDELKFRGLLHGQVGGLGPLEDLVHVGGRTAVEVRKVRSIGHQTAGHNPFPYAKHARQVPLG